MTTKSDQNQSEHEQHKKHERKMYLIFAAMITTSTVTMFLLTYTNAFTWSHMTFSEERVYMAILMGSAMTIIMLGFMWGMMYKNVKVNAAIIVAALVVGGSALWLSRSQTFVQDESYMKGMIPHHSIAILTSERAQIEDPRVRKLADEIIAAQRREIAEMKYLIRAIERDGVQATRDTPPAAPSVAGPREALAGAQLAKVDLGELEATGITRVLGPGPHCTFGYAPGTPVVAASVPRGATAGRGVVKLHGTLVPLDARPASGGGFDLVSDALTVRVRPERGRDGTAVLRLANGPEIGYAGVYRCGD